MTWEENIAKFLRAVDEIEKSLPAQPVEEEGLRPIGPAVVRWARELAAQAQAGQAGV